MALTQDISEFHRPIILNNGQFKQLPDDEGLTIGGLNYPLLPLTADEDIYLDENGDDDTGDGSQGSPWQTLQRAQDAYLNILPGNFDINIHISGHIEHDDQLNMVYPYGAALQFFGENTPETFLNATVSNIQSAATDANYAELEYIDLDIDLSGMTATPAVGDMVRCAAGSGGTNPETLEGGHTIIAESSGTVTVRMWRALNTTEVPSGSITVSGILYQDGIDFTGDTNGLVISGPISGGTWENVFIRGNSTAAASRTAVLVNSSGSFNTIGPVLFHDWLRGVSAANNGFADTPSGVYSKMRDVAMASSTAGTIRAQSSTRVSGCEFAIWANNNGCAIVNTLRAICAAGAPQCILAELGSRVIAQNAVLRFDDGAATGMLADDVSQIVSTGSTLTGFATDYSPTVNTVGNGHSFIVN